MGRNSSLDLKAALELFKSANPDLPEGEAPEEPAVESVKGPGVLDIVFEKKGRAGKQATIIAGFDVDDADRLQTVASELKRRLGAGGSARGGEILIQGDRRKDVLKILVEMGYKARII